MEWDEYTGRTEAVESVDVRPRVSGYIDQISFKDGQLVKPGDVLFVIDPRPYQDVLDQDKANLQSAGAQRQLKEANFARAQRLFQNNVTAKEEYDTRPTSIQRRTSFRTGLQPPNHGYPIKFAHWVSLPRKNRPI